MTSMLSFRGVAKSYGQTRVLERVDLEVARGEYVVLVGPSGCGKSTLLRCIAGLEDVSAGELWIEDRCVNTVAPRDRDVAMVFQSYALYPHLSVRQNIAFPLQVRRRPKAEIDAAVEEVARMLNLSELLDRRPAELSGGQRQRVAMGRAIVRRPKVFLFDEPLSNLDASLRHQMRVELKRLHRRLEATIVHVTHDQIEALTLADRLVVLNRGVIQQVGTPREIYDSPANQFVATFVGAPAMNLLDVDGHGAFATVRASGLNIEVAGNAAGDGRCVLGVRPSDLELAPSGAPLATVDVIEPMGGEALVHLDLGGQPLMAVVREPCPVMPGAKVGLRVGVAHRFHPEHGARL